jgi:hypothetical protein
MLCLCKFNFKNINISIKNMFYFKKQILLFFAINTVFLAFSQLPAIGDKDFLLDTTGLLSLKYCVNEWQKAGVEGGIPTCDNKYILKANPKSNLQECIDKLARRGTGVVLLSKGDYIIDKPLMLKNGVVLRGESKTEVRLLVRLKGQFWRVKNSMRVGAILLHGIERAGIENLTIKYDAVDFEPLDYDVLDAKWDRAIFHQREMRDTALFVEQIWINQSRNCWVQDCRILWAGSDPIRITLSDHITCRRNYIDRCYNKNDGGMGYYNISNSRYVLVANDTVRRIRHFAIQNFSKFNVVLINYFEVDINFHDGDSGCNLIMNNKVVIPEWHSWNAVSRGVPEQHLPPGHNNILLNNSFVGKDNKKKYSEQAVFYELNDRWEGGLVK